MAYFNIQHETTHCSTFVEKQLQHLLINKCWTVYHRLRRLKPVIHGSTFVEKQMVPDVEPCVIGFSLPLVHKRPISPFLILTVNSFLYFKVQKLKKVQELIGFFSWQWNFCISCFFPAHRFQHRLKNWWMYTHYLAMDMEFFLLNDKDQVAVIPWFRERMLRDCLFLFLRQPFIVQNEQTYQKNLKKYPALQLPLARSWTITVAHR